MDIRFLGHACLRAEHDGDTVLIDPFLTGNPKAPPRPTSSMPTTILAHPRSRRPLSATRRHRQAHRRTVVAITELADELGDEGVENVYDPNLGGTVEFDWGWVRLVARLAHLDHAEGHGEHAGRPA